MDAQALLQLSRTAFDQLVYAVATSREATGAHEQALRDPDVVECTAAALARLVDRATELRDQAQASGDTRTAATAERALRLLVVQRRQVQRLADGLLAQRLDDERGSRGVPYLAMVVLRMLHPRDYLAIKRKLRGAVREGAMFANGAAAARAALPLDE